MEIYSNPLVFSFSELITLVNHFFLAYTFSRCKFKICSWLKALYLVSFLIINIAMFNNASYPVVLLLSIIMDAFIFLNCIDINLKKGISLYILVIIVNTFLDIVIEQVSSVIDLENILPIILIPIMHRMMAFVIILFIFTIFILLRRKSNIYIFNNHMYLCFHMAISFFTSSMILMLVIIYGENLKQLLNIFLIATAIFTILANLSITLIYVKKAEENIQYKDEISIKNELLTFQENYFFYMVTSYSNLRKFKHDINGYITTINQLVYDRDYENLLQLTRSMSGIVKDNYVISCNNVYVGAIANHFYHMCKRNEVNFEFHFQLINGLKMKPEHICSLFYNLLNNAVEAAIKSKEKKVNITVKNKDRAMIIYLRNSVTDKFDINTINLKITSKLDKVNHGIGLKSIDSVIMAYNGQYDYKKDGEYLISTIILLGVIENYA